MKSKSNRYVLQEDVISELDALLKDDSFRTLSGYSIDVNTYPDHKVPFTENHINYLKKHPQVNPKHYLSNLRLMLKIR